MKFLVCLLMTVIFTSCGESPLLNHKMEKNGLINDAFRSESEGHLFKKSNYSFKLEWIEGPAKGENKFLIKSWNHDTGSLNGPFQDLPHQLHVYLWMPDMGHGSAPVKLKKIADGEYEVSNVYFIMGGKWEIYFQLLKSKDVVLDEVVLPFSL